MGKVCLACGLARPAPQKPKEEPEDCPSCGGKGTVKGEEDEGEEEGEGKGD